MQDLGYAPMDKIHAELDALLLRARSPVGRDSVVQLAEIDSHLRSHFTLEDRWMLETGFPASGCHIDEHAAVLNSSAQVLELARRGNVVAVPAFLAELERWFPGHATHLDSALAAWMCRRTYGGTPVVLHRTRASSPSTSIDPELTR
jgi:hemerythrin